MAGFTNNYPRFLAAPLAEAIGWSRVVALTGARQAGKTTLVRSLGPSRRFVTLDDPQTLAAAAADPTGFLAGLTRPVTIDEIQRAPQLLLPIKLAVDRNPEKGDFLLTGSANLLTLPKVADSLAGRMAVFELYPLSQSEIENCPSNAVDRIFARDPGWRSLEETPQRLIDRVVRGGFPEALGLADEHRTTWAESYIETLVQRDIVEITRIEHATQLRRLVRVLAARSGRVLNGASLANDVALPPRTIQRYLELLELTFLIFRIPSWSFDRARRAIKSPKTFCSDTGLTAAVMNLDTSALLSDRNQFGGLFETFVVSELRKQRSWSALRPDLYHFRSYDGAEVDLILETRDGRRVGIEIKASATIGRNESKPLLRLLDEARLERGVVLYTGSEYVPLRKDAAIVPVANLWTP